MASKICGGQYKTAYSKDFFVDWIANGSPPWVAYRAFMSSRMIALDKQSGVRPVCVGEIWWRLFVNIVIKFTGPESTMELQDDQRCAGIKAGINRKINGDQALWDENLTT